MRILFFIVIAQLIACTPSQPSEAPSKVQEAAPVAVPATPLAVEAEPVADVALAPMSDTNAPKPAAAAKTASRPAADVVLTPSQTATAPAAQPKIAIEEVGFDDMAVEAPVSVPDHGLWNDLLTEHVSATGRVDYTALKASEASVDAYLATLQQYPPTRTWSKNEIMAYWINAYNAFTVKLILKNHPTTSIKNIDGGNPWDTKWIKLAGSTYSLNQIENDILRRQYGDARIHFAVNCAAKSCPPLHNRAFTAKNLNATLSQLTRKFINNPAFNTLGAKELRLSRIFDWYQSDFGNLIGFLSQYTDVPIAEDATIQYNEYEWILNGK